MATVARAGQDPAASISDANEDLRLYSMLGDIDLVLLMLVRGAHVDDTEPVEGNTALLEACRNGHTEVALELLKHGAQIARENLMKDTPIRVAVRNGHAHTVQMLVRHGASVREPRGWTGLLEAAKLGHANVLAILASEHEGGTGGFGGVNTTNMIGETGLMLAAANGDVAVARTLLDFSADADAQDSQGTTALMKAASSGQAAVAELLLQHGANVSLVDDHGDTAVLYASRHGHLDVLRSLIDYGAAAYTGGGKRLFDQPAWGPNAINALHTGMGTPLQPSLLSGLGRSGNRSTVAAGSPLLHTQAINMQGVSTLKTSGTLARKRAVSSFGTQLSLPDIHGASRQRSGKQDITAVASSISHGDEEYRLAKKKLLDDLFGPPPKVVEPNKPHKAADGTAFETRQELREYEEENLPHVCGACKQRFKEEEEAWNHFRATHKPAGFLTEEAKAARDRGTVQQAWLELDLDELYTDMHDLRASIVRSLEDNSVDADELDAIIRQLRRCDVPVLALDRLLVALGDGDTSEEDKKLLLRYCPDDVPQQKASLFDALVIYQGHIELLFAQYSQNPGTKLGDALTKSNFSRLLQDCGLLGADFKKANADLIFERVVKHRETRNMDGTKASAKELTIAEFVNALVRVATAKFTKLLGIHDKFLWMMTQFVQQHESVRIVDDSTSEEMSSKRIQTIINEPKTKAALKKSFGRFGEKRDAQNVMTLKGFADMLQSCKITDEILTERECRFCFMSVNDSETSGKAATGGTSAACAIVVSYDGFLEVLAQMARSKFVLPTMDPKNFSKPVKLPSLAPLFAKFIADILTKVQGLDFWQLKRVGLNMKRFAKRKNVARKDAMEHAWKLIDVDSSGALDRNELQTMLEQMELPSDDAAVEHAMKEIDTDGSGLVEHDEFAAWFEVQDPDAQKKASAMGGAEPIAPQSAEEKITLRIAEKLGHDAAEILAEASRVRTAMYSVMSNYGASADAREMILTYLRDSGVSQDLVENAEESLKAVQEGGKLKAKAKKTLMEYNIQTSPEEELPIIVKALEMSKKLIETVFFYYGTGIEYDAKRPLGAMDGIGFLDMLTELKVLSNSDVEAGLPPPRTYCEQLLDRVKQMREGDGRPTPSHGKAIARWTWPNSDANLGGEPIDSLTVEELHRLFVRIAHDRRKKVRGGIGLRVAELLKETVARHWCHTIDHKWLENVYKSKGLQSIISTNRTDIRKIWKAVCDWPKASAMDLSQWLLFLEACDYSYLPVGRRLRYLFLAVRAKHDDKDMIDIWLKGTVLLCKDCRTIQANVEESDVEIPAATVAPPPLHIARPPQVGDGPGWPLVDAEVAQLPPEAGGAPVLADEKKTPFSKQWGDWFSGGMLALPWNWEDHLKKVRQKKQKLAKKERQKMEKRARKEAKKAAAAAAAAMDAGEADTAVHNETA